MKISTSIRPHRSLSKILKKHSGRDNTGTISIRHQGGRQKRKYRLLDLQKTQTPSEKQIIAIEYDPNRSANIFKLKDEKGDISYELQIKGLKVGDKLRNQVEGDAELGVSMPLANIPLGSEIHALQTAPGTRAKMIRSAGSYGVLLAKDGEYADIKLPSREIKKFLLACVASIGRVAEVESRSRRKAGATRHKGVRPTVRGTAQNPRSHPHGGGEGRSGEGMIPKTPWGKMARGKKTANRHRHTKKLIVKSRKG